MAARADFIEVALARLRIPDQNIELQPDRIASRRTALPADGGQHAVNVLRYRSGVAVVQDDLRVVLADRLADQLPVLIVQRGLRAQEARALVRPPQVGG